MVARRKPSKSQIHQLKITLLNTEPPIWRRVLILNNLTLGDLHDVIQISMGWNDAHLHQFRQGEISYSDPEFELDENPEIEVIDEQKVKISQVLAKPKDALIYEYDFGDGWRHLIELETPTAKNEEIPDVPICLEGQRSCPPEDCGGTYAYLEMLKSPKNPKDPHYQELKDWLPDGFSPDFFDLRRVNYVLYKVFGV